jgi:hypothetical protein
VKNLSGEFCVRILPNAELAEADEGRTAFIRDHLWGQEGMSVLRQAGEQASACERVWHTPVSVGQSGPDKAGLGSG